MGLRIRTNMASLRAQRAMEKTEAANQLSMEKLASGYRINKAADDAAGLAISEKLKAKARSLGQAKQNASDGISVIQIAEGGMQEINNILIRLRELAVQAASDTIANPERSYANAEYVQLVEEIDRIANSTEFNGYRLLKGPEANNDLRNFTIHVGAGDGSTPNTDTIDLNIEKLKLDAQDVLGLGTGDEIGPLNAEDTDDFTRDIAAAKLTVIDEAMKHISTARAELGAKQNRLSSAITALSVAAENAYSSNSRIRDVDFASETANFTQQKILGQAGISVLSQANSWPEIALSLLR